MAATSKISKGKKSKKLSRPTEKPDFGFMKELDSYDPKKAAAARRREREAAEKLEAETKAKNVPTILLPVQGTSLPEEQSNWKTIGVILGDKEPHDRLFRRATLPEGWKIVKTGHHMWTDLVDEQGRRRASIMYKAAIYDRDAAVSLIPRFSAYYRKDEKTETLTPTVTDGEKEVFTGEPIPWRPHSRENNFTGQKDEAIQKASAWLVENGFPDFKNPCAYW